MRINNFIYKPDHEDRRKAEAAVVETATVAADGRQEARMVAAERPAAQLQLDVPKPSAPRACAACCGRYGSPS